MSLTSTDESYLKEAQEALKDAGSRLDIVEWLVTQVIACPDAHCQAEKGEQCNWPGLRYPQGDHIVHTQRIRALVNWIRMATPKATL